MTLAPPCGEAPIGDSYTVQGTRLSPSVLRPFKNALDSKGQLSAESYAELGKLRGKVAELSRQVSEYGRKGRGAMRGGGEYVLLEELDEAERRLRLAEHQILRGLTEQYAKHAASVVQAVAAAAVVDVMCAREHLAFLTTSSRPEVRDEGVVRVLSARHPLLVLR